MSNSVASRFSPPKKQELLVRREFAPDVATWMFENWIDTKNYHASWWPSKEMWFCKKEKLTPAALARMFTSAAANTPIGAYYIDADGNVKHLALDIDAHKEGETAEEPLRAAQRLLDHFRWPYTVARSKGGKGYHLRIHFDRPIPAYVARNIGNEIVRAAGLPKKTEVFPKQDELREGEFGSQVALPGSLFFSTRTGGVGSTLVDPSTLDPIPFGEWLDFLRSVPPLSEKTLREIGEATGHDLWKKKERPKFTFNPEDFKAEGVPDFATVEQLAGFLASHGIEVQREKGAFGEWTDRLLLMTCANATAHGSSRSDGAAVLFNGSNGRVGYKCWHEGCAQFSWPKLLKNLGYRFTRRASEDDQEATLPEDYEPAHPRFEVALPDDPCGIDCDHEHRDHGEPAPEERGGKKRKPRERFPFEVDRIAMRDEVKRASLTCDAWAVASTLAYARCCDLYDKLWCGKMHGKVQFIPERCNKQGCMGCAIYIWLTRHVPFITEKWPEQAFIAEVAVGSPEEARAEAFERMIRFRKRKEHKPRWLRGWGTTIYIFDPEDALYAADAGLEGEIVSKEKYLPMLRRVWLSIAEGVEAEYKATGDMIGVYEKHKAILNNHKRTSAGKVADLMFPWMSSTKFDLNRAEKWEKEHPGLKRGSCDFIEGRNDDGSPIYCGQAKCRARFHKRTGVKVKQRVGPWQRGEIEEASAEADNAYFAGYQLQARITAAG